jgi:ligand-binding sensor domain-containing protein/DNA-binding CsgD family transcriptional regulator
MIRFFWILLIPVGLMGQNTIGLPDLINYSNQHYTAGLQNWDIKQDARGVIYVANNEGLLIYNGISWGLNPLPHKTIVRSLAIGPDGKIFAGGQDELGYFSPSEQGRMSYHSLVETLPVKFRSFGDVWDIVCLKKDVYFRTAGQIFKLTQNSFQPYPAKSDWLFLDKCGERLFAQDRMQGLMIFENGYWKPMEYAAELQPSTITGIMDEGGGLLLVATLKNGLYRLGNGKCEKLSNATNSLFQQNRIYTAAGISNNLIALGSSNNGVYIINRNGDIIQKFSKKEGLQNDNVLSLFPDRQGNLWLGLDNGIDFIAYNSAIKQINPKTLDASGYTAALHDGKLYIGTSKGLYFVPVPPAFNDLSFTFGEFSDVQNTAGQVWNLTEINNRLLMGHHEGAFLINNDKAAPLTTMPGVWNFIPTGSIMPAEKILAGHYKGILEINFRQNSFMPANSIPGFDESCRFIATDPNDNIWVSHPYHGLFKISPGADGTYTIVPYTEKDGLPSLLNNHVYKVKNKLLAATEKGIYTLNEKNNRFEPEEEYAAIFGNRSIRYLKEDAEGNIWYIQDKRIGVIDFSGKNWQDIEIPELSRKMLSGFECIYPVNRSNILLGGEKGFFHINYEKYRKEKNLLQVQISSIRLGGATDSILYGGYALTTDSVQNHTARHTPSISSGWKSIRISFAAPLYGNQPSVEYAYRLSGYEKEWSKWSGISEKEYTNLPPGNYLFEVRARSRAGNESDTAQFSFILLPPWYQTIWARLLMTVLLLVAGYVLYRKQKDKFSKQQIRHNQEQQKLMYIHELEKNKAEGEIIALSKEKLEAEINFKNAELASSAMHLVKKGELLAKIKGELSKIIKSIENPQAISELKKLTKSLSEDDNIDREWDNFSKHFDKVQSDFLIALKEQHPAITANELKLSAYLRMNLSTKEISQLMNISVRGVEISRYRLRKKLELATETSLFDYLTRIHKKPDEASGKL